jgi:hypothetical protein
VLGLDYPDSRLLLQAGAKAAKELICSRMQQMGCAGKT